MLPAEIGFIGVKLVQTHMVVSGLGQRERSTLRSMGVGGNERLDGQNEPVETNDFDSLALIAQRVDKWRVENLTNHGGYTGLCATCGREAMRWLTMALVLTSCVGVRAAEPPLLQPEFWRAEGVEHLAPLWLKHAPDEAFGGFRTRLSRNWQPEESAEKMPAMLSRQIYGLSAAYLLSGDDRYLEAARDGADFLLTHGWDERHGGWFDQLTRDGEPMKMTKTISLQLYTNVGLTMYGFTTGDDVALEHVNRSLQIQRTRARDPIHGGYAQQLDRDLSVLDWGKNKHAHYGYVGSLLLNLYLTTGDDQVLDYSRELTDLSLDKMRGPGGWLYGFQSKFDRQWQRTPKVIEGVEVASIGAQLTAALALLRLHEQTGAHRYLEAGLELGQRTTQTGFDEERGAWLEFIAAKPPHERIGETKVHWWHQVYGGFLQLHLYHLTGDKQFLDNFEKTERFFTENFHDREHGGVFPAVDLDGNAVGQPRKASPWRTSYHEMEHALLNYLYLSLFVHRQPAVLHFCFDGAGDFRVNPVDAPGVQIESVMRNGQPWHNFDRRRGTVQLPAGKRQKVVVTLAM